MAAVDADTGGKTSRRSKPLTRTPPMQNMQHSLTLAKLIQCWMRWVKDSIKRCTNSLPKFSIRPTQLATYPTLNYINQTSLGTQKDKRYG